jgi:hypothetical protein
MCLELRRSGAQVSEFFYKTNDALTNLNRIMGLPQPRLGPEGSEFYYESSDTLIAVTRPPEDLIRLVRSLSAPISVP